MGKTAKEFSRKMIFIIATEYAETDAERSYQYFCQRYNISKSTFYAILERAVVENIVQDETVEKMAAKAGFNSGEKAGKGARKRSNKHYAKLQQRREEFVLPKKASIEYVSNYAKSAQNNKEFARRNYISLKLLNRTILKAIVNSWISEDVFYLLKAKSCKEYGTAKVHEFWEQLERFRNENNKNQR